MIPMSKLQYTFKTDTLFKMLFVKHVDLLKKLVAALLGIAPESIEQFTVRRRCRRRLWEISSVGLIST